MKRSQNKLTEKYEALARAIDMNGPTIKRVLEEALANRSPRIKALAAEGVGKRRIKSLLPNLLSMIRDKNSWVRRTAIESIGQISSSESTALAIVDCLNDKEKLVRVSTAEALGEIGNPAAVEHLAHALSDRSDLVRAYVAEALGRIGTRRAHQILQNHLSKEGNERVKVDLYFSLYSLGEHEYFGPLLALLESDDLMTRCAVADALAALSPDVPERSRVISALKRQLRAETTVLAKDCISRSLESLTEAH